jgi:uncharacterized protein YpuA (DUF1002 family)
MEKDLLQAVIKVESAIQKSIETERKKAAEWLESVRVSLSQALEAKKQQLEEEYARYVNEMVENLQNITDEMLQEIVRGFLQDILPAEKR